MQNASAVVLTLLVAGALAGSLTACTESLEQKEFALSDRAVHDTFEMLDQMKREDLITADQHEQLRRVLVQRLESGLPMGPKGRGSFEVYISQIHTKLAALRRLQRDGRITPDEFNQRREEELRISM